MNSKTFDYIYTKQYDVGRKVYFTITKNSATVPLSGLNAVFSLKKPDGNLILRSSTDNELVVNAAQNRVELTLDDQITVLSGKLPYEISLLDGTNTISTVTGFIQCEKAAVQKEDVESVSNGSLMADLAVVADAVRDGNVFDGDSVNFSQTLQSGTEVGRITINGTEQTLYAPTPSGTAGNTVEQDYATSLGSTNHGVLLGANAIGTDTTDKVYTSPDFYYNANSKKLTIGNVRSSRGYWTHVEGYNDQADLDTLLEDMASAISTKSAQAGNAYGVSMYQDANSDGAGEYYTDSSINVVFDNDGNPTFDIDGNIDCNSINGSNFSLANGSLTFNGDVVLSSGYWDVSSGTGNYRSLKTAVQNLYAADSSALSDLAELFANGDISADASSYNVYFSGCDIKLGGSQDIILDSGYWDDDGQGGGNYTSLKGAVGSYFQSGLGDLGDLISSGYFVVNPSSGSPYSIGVTDLVCLKGYWGDDGENASLSDTIADIYSKLDGGGGGGGGGGGTSHLGDLDTLFEDGYMSVSSQNLSFQSGSGIEFDGSSEYCDVTLYNGYWDGNGGEYTSLREATEALFDGAGLGALDGFNRAITHGYFNTDGYNICLYGVNLELYSGTTGNSPDVVLHTGHWDDYTGHSGSYTSLRDAVSDLFENNGGSATHLADLDTLFANGDISVNNNDDLEFDSNIKLDSGDIINRTTGYWDGNNMYSSLKTAVRTLYANVSTATTNISNLSTDVGSLSSLALTIQDDPMYSDDIVSAINVLEARGDLSDLSTLADFVENGYFTTANSPRTITLSDLDLVLDDSSNSVADVTISHGYWDATTNGTIRSLKSAVRGLYSKELGDIPDVELTTPSNGQILKYNSTTQKWVNANESGGAGAINDLTDVTISSPANGDILKYNSTSQEWENDTLPSYTEVEANPSGTATTTLTKLQVGNTIYAIPSGGGGSLVPILVDIFDGASTITPSNTVGVTVSTSSVNNFVGAINGSEWSDGYEGFNIPLKNLVVGKQYRLNFDFQFSNTDWFVGQYVTGYILSSTNITDYENYTNWTTNLDQDLLKHNHIETFVATATTMYLCFNLCGCSDGQTNYWDISDLSVVSLSGVGEVTVTQVQSTGAKIATIGVDGINTDLYAPQETYSTTEQVIGTWINDEPLYRKAITFSGNYQLTQTFTLSDVTSDMIIHNVIGGVRYVDNGTLHNYLVNTDGNVTCPYQGAQNQLNINLGASSANIIVELIIEYTKTSNA